MGHVNASVLLRRYGELQALQGAAGDSLTLLKEDGALRHKAVESRLDCLEGVEAKQLEARCSWERAPGYWKSAPR